MKGPSAHPNGLAARRPATLVTFASSPAVPAPVTMNVLPVTKGVAMAQASHVEITQQELDAIAWRFFGSEFSGPIYADWPMDRRVDGYLRHHGPIEVVNHCSTYDALLERVMANIARARRSGVLTCRKPWVRDGSGRPDGDGHRHGEHRRDGRVLAATGLTNAECRPNRRPIGG